MDKSISKDGDFFMDAQKRRVKLYPQEWLFFTRSRPTERVNAAFRQCRLKTNYGLSQSDI